MMLIGWGKENKRTSGSPFMKRRSWYARDRARPEVRDGSRDSTRRKKRCSPSGWFRDEGGRTAKENAVRRPDLQNNAPVGRSLGVL